MENCDVHNEEFIQGKETVCDANGAKEIRIKALESLMQGFINDYDSLLEELLKHGDAPWCQTFCDYNDKIREILNQQ